MKFYEKLSILMDITNTTNRELAHYSSLDPSHISRLKNGLRGPVEGASYLTAFSQFLSRRIASPSQQDLLMRLFGLDTSATHTQEELTLLFIQWLTQDDWEEKYEYKPSELLPNQGQEEDLSASNRVACNIYYGDIGKRQAAIGFLDAIRETPTKQPLLFSSDEDMDWMTGDADFALRWAQRMRQVLSGGTRIKIIHDLNRGLDEILAAIRAWIPLYMTGAIEPYYYPRIRDGVYKRSLYIAPGVGAVTSSSIGTMPHDEEESVTFFYTNPSVVKALEKDYQHYLKLCRPLMDVMTSGEESPYLEVLANFEGKSGDTILKSKHLSSISMPEPVLRSILDRVAEPNRDQLLAFHQTREALFLKALETHSITEVLSLPTGTALRRGEVGVDHSFGSDRLGLFYTKEEYLDHLAHVLEILKHHENYHVMIEKTPYDLGYVLYAKENHGALVIKSAPPLVFLSVKENPLAVGFWDFLVELCENNRRGRKKTILQLEEAIHQYKGE